MKYAITPDLKIHEVIDEKLFYKHNPKAQDITFLEGVYEKFCEQEIKEKRKNSENKQGLLIQEDNSISLPCGSEPQFGRCKWGYSHKHKAYICSICGNEFIRLYTRKQIEEELKKQHNETTN
jgi:hypothetical protein